MVQSVIGTQMPGSFIRVECEPYLYTPKDSDEEMLISHRWEYSPDEDASVAFGPKTTADPEPAPSVSLDGLQELV